MLGSAIDNAYDTEQQAKADSWLHSPNAMQYEAWEALSDVVYEQLGFTDDKDKIIASLLPLVSKALGHYKKQPIAPLPGKTKKRLLKRELPAFQPLVDEAVKRLVDYAAAADLSRWFGEYTAEDMWPGNSPDDWFYPPPPGVDPGDDQVQQDIQTALARIIKGESE
jgi:hypothetical protein